MINRANKKKQSNVVWLFADITKKDSCTMEESICRKDNAVNNNSVINNNIFGFSLLFNWYLNVFNNLILNSVISIYVSFRFNIFITLDILCTAFIYL